jgi:hypothetical protein
LRKSGSVAKAHEEHQNRAVSNAADGSELEQAVAEIERALLPEGFAVDQRTHVADSETGEIIAELDIMIKGPLGSSTVEWLVECRDRKSTGPAPASWIEQLKGRRDRFNLQRVFAVSTTGFSNPARALAKQFGIELRTVREISDIAQDFNSISFTVCDHRFEAKGQVGMRGPVGDVREKGKAEFRKLGEKNFVSLGDFVTETLRARGSPPTGALPTVKGVTTIDFDYPRRCHIRLPSGRQLQIEGFTVPGEIHTEVFEARVLTATVYADDGGVIGKQGHYEWNSPRGRVRATVTLAKNGVVKLEIPDGQLPPGVTPRGFHVERTPRKKGSA